MNDSISNPGALKKCGLAPALTEPARQVADRSHLVQNLREMIEKQLGRLERPLRAQGSAAIEDEDTRAGLHRLRQVSFEQVRLLYDAGKTATAITVGRDRQALGEGRHHRPARGRRRCAGFRCEVCVPRLEQRPGLLGRGCNQSNVKQLIRYAPLIAIAAEPIDSCRPTY
jgi:hypothetical protein